MTVNNVSELRTVYRPPAPRAAQKVLDHLDVHCRNFIALSPLCVLSTVNSDGQPDASTLLLPDRPGNNQVDSLQNVLENPRVGLLFFVPGMNETLRVKGRAEIVTEQVLLDGMKERSRPPVSGCGSRWRRRSCTAGGPCCAPAPGTRRRRSTGRPTPPTGRCWRTK